MIFISLTAVKSNFSIILNFDMPNNVMNIFFSLGNQENTDYNTVKKAFSYKEILLLQYMLVFNLVIKKVHKN